MNDIWPTHRRLVWRAALLVVAMTLGACGGETTPQQDPPPVDEEDTSSDPEDTDDGTPDTSTEPDLPPEDTPEPPPDVQTPQDTDEEDDAAQTEDTSEPPDEEDVAEDTQEPPPQPDAEPWPDTLPPQQALVSMVIQGQTVAPGQTLIVNTAPAGLEQATTYDITLTNRSDQTLDFGADPAAWLQDDTLQWGTPPPTALAPQESTNLRLSFNAATVTQATTLTTRLSLPGQDAHLDFALEVPAPLRMVVVGVDNTTLISDTYGADFIDAQFPQGSETARERVTWGNGLFLRSWADGRDWGDPGRYATSPDGVTWTSANTSDAFWASQCAYGAGRFACAVAASLSWSDNGATVIHEAGGCCPMSHAMAFGDDRFIAVGRDSRRSISFDGQTWDTEHREQDGHWLNAVAYAGEGSWVATGGRGNLFVMHSQDHGETWESWFDADGSESNSVACSPTRCVFSTGGSPAYTWTSDDRGQTWQSHTQPNWVTYNILGVANGWFIAAINPYQQGAQLVRSRDGVQWEQVHQLPGTTHIRAMAIAQWTPDTSFRLSDTPVDAPAPDPVPGDPDDDIAPGCDIGLRASINGAPVDAPVRFPAAPAQGDPVELRLELENTCDVALRFLGHPTTWSTDPRFGVQTLPPVVLEPGQSTTITLRFDPTAPGLTQGEFILPYNLPGSPLTVELSAEVGEPLALVLVGDGRHVITTHDYGATIAHDSYETLEAHGDELQRGVCWGAGRFVAVGGNVDRRWWTSPDGVQWQAHDSQEGGPMADCAWGNGRFVSSDGSPVWSADGITWNSGQRYNFNPNHLRGSTYGGGLFVFVGDNGRVAVTEDGESWLRDTVLSIGGLRNIAWGGGVFVAVGAEGWIASSSDGAQTWVTQQLGTGDWGGVAYADGRFLIGDGARVASSTDGEVWNIVNATPAVPRAGLGRQFFGTNANTLYRSTDGGFSWTELYQSPAGLNVGNAAFAGMEDMQ